MDSFSFKNKSMALIALITHHYYIDRSSNSYYNFSLFGIPMMFYSIKVLHYCWKNRSQLAHADGGDKTCSTSLSPPSSPTH